MNLRFIPLLIVTVMICSACESLSMNKGESEAQDNIIVDDVSVVTLPSSTSIDMPAQFSNESVIVFPVTGEIDSSRTIFPEYRGVLENTTAGGYTVFDPSVSVFALDGRGVRPNYLPEYSVPQYAEQYKSVQPASPTPMPIDQTQIISERLEPIGLMSSQIVNNDAMAMPADNGYKTTTPLRRSYPILTSYD